ncbi:mevalonate kinase [Microbacterium betulae]|uniref:mevalonate kinase n=1 Tax=Microbacterium betulae TaxID=2981139 RepID=A0AA97FI82_9MICO|nr:mevalonate kinase [Microbacterium sp. AB]WOF23711.1 mevalonate kinase [Microbacterium sp. AB]
MNPAETALPLSAPAGGPDGPPGGRAHAKAILLGEHAVVYGAPAIAVPVRSLEATAALVPSTGSKIRSALYTGPAADAPPSLAPVLAAWHAAAERCGTAGWASTLTVRSDIPGGRGLGSSAAVAAAVASAVAAQARIVLSDEERHALIQRAETVAHGRPSGIDARAVVATSPFRFQRGAADPIDVGAPLAFVIADTGTAGSTADAVASVRALRDSHPRTVDTAVERMAELADEAAIAIAEADPDALGARMSAAHEILALLGVSSPGLDSLTRAAHAAGSPGAKLTGGGRGGCVIALSLSPDTAGLERALRSAGAVRTWTTTLAATA